MKKSIKLFSICILVWTSTSVGANFSQARMIGTIFNGRNLDGFKFTRAKMICTQFIGVSLRNADLQYADLTNANFQRADLRGADFEGTNLTGTKFKGALYDAITDWTEAYYLKNGKRFSIDQEYLKRQGLRYIE